jgi:hypothetical protein
MERKKIETGHTREFALGAINAPIVKKLRPAGLFTGPWRCRGGARERFGLWPVAVASAGYRRLGADRK